MEERQRLDPNISIGTLKLRYGQFTEILIRPEKVSLPRIGSLVQFDEMEFQVAAGL